MLYLICIIVCQETGPVRRFIVLVIYIIYIYLFRLMDFVPKIVTRTLSILANAYIVLN